MLSLNGAFYNDVDVYCVYDLGSFKINVYDEKIDLANLSEELTSFFLPLPISGRVRVGKNSCNLREKTFGV